MAFVLKWKVGNLNTDDPTQLEQDKISLDPFFLAIYCPLTQTSADSNHFVFPFGFPLEETTAL